MVEDRKQVPGRHLSELLTFVEAGEGGQGRHARQARRTYAW